MPAEPAEVDEFDNVSTGDLVRQKDELRVAATGRDLRERALRRREQQASMSPAPQGEGESSNQGPDRVANASLSDLVTGAERQAKPSLLRHVSPIEAFGGALETIPDLTDLMDDIANALPTGAALEELLESKDLPSGIFIGPDGLTFQRQGVEEGEPRKSTFGQLGDLIPTVGDPEAGSIIREISNFAVGFAGAGKIRALQNLSKGGKAAKIADATVRGFLADFIASDEEDGRVVDLAEGTAVDNPVFDLLQSREGEGALERRLKQSAEGAAMGLAMDTVVIPALRFAGKVVRAQTGAKAALDTFEEVAQKVELQRADLEALVGKPDAPLVSRVADDAVEAVGGAGRASGGEPGGVTINFSRINSSDDVKQAMQELADSFSDSIGDAQRGVRTHEATKLAAEEIDAFDLLEKAGRERGVTLNAEETLALRELWVASSRKTDELATAVASETATPGAQIAFRRQLAVHSAIQERVLAVRTETARALNQWRIPAGDTVQFSNQFDQMVSQANATSGAVVDLAKLIKQAKLDGDIGVVDNLVYGSRWAKTKDAVGALYYFSLLSGPHTHMRNLASNALMLPTTLAERKLANLIGRGFGDEQVATGEVSAALSGIFSGARDAFRISSMGRANLKRAAAARTAGHLDEMRQILDEAGDDIGTFHKARVSGESGFGVNKVEASPISAFAPDKLGIEGWKNHPIGQFFYHASRGLDAVTTMPTRALSAGDEIAKTINARMELHALAYRQAAKEAGSGVVDSLDARYAEILSSPDESMQILARETAERNTFTNTPADSASWQTLSRLRRIPVIGTFLVPFVRTPYNLVTQSARRSLLAPLAKSWRDDLLAGGARTDKALAEFALGNAAMLTFADMTIRGDITGGGPNDPAQVANLKRQGWKPYSVRIGDNYFSYRGLEPISTLIGMAADATELVGHTDFEEEDEEMGEIVTSLLFATMATVQNKTYLQGLSNFFEVQSDPKRYGETFVERSAGVVMPAVGAHLNRAAFDGYAREVNGPIEAIKARTPGLSQDLPPRRDVWGRPIPYGSHLGGLYDFFIPFYASKHDPEPIDEALEELELWIRKPQRKTKLGGEKVNLWQFPEAYDDLVRLSGNEMTHDVNGVPVDISGLGMKDALNALVTGQHPMSPVYQLSAPDGREEMIKDMQRRYTEAAKDHVIQMHPELGGVVKRKKDRREAEEMSALRGFN